MGMRRGGGGRFGCLIIIVMHSGFSSIYIYIKIMIITCTSSVSISLASLFMGKNGVPR